VLLIETAKIGCDISIVSAVIFVSSLEHAVVDVSIIIKVIKILFRCLLTLLNVHELIN
jgi:hypothetical protein